MRFCFLFYQDIQKLTPAFRAQLEVFGIRPRVLQDVVSTNRHDFRKDDASLFHKYCCTDYAQTMWEKQILTRVIEMRGYLQFSFWTPTALAKIRFSHIVINHAKIPLY